VKLTRTQQEAMRDGWRCHEDGCPTKGAKQFPVPPMTPQEGFERHHRTQHPDTGRRK